MKKFHVFLALMLTVMLTCSLALAGSRYGCPEGSMNGLSHWYGRWYSNLDGTHHAECIADECKHEKDQPCAAFTFTKDGATYSVCPICGECELGRFAFTTGRTLGAGMPNGERIIRSLALPFGDGSDVLAAYTLAWEQLGLLEELNTTAHVSCKCIVEGDFTLVLVDGENLTEIPYTVAGGQLLFDAVQPGVYLLLAK